MVKRYLSSSPRIGGWGFTLQGMLFSLPSINPSHPFVTPLLGSGRLSVTTRLGWVPHLCVLTSPFTFYPSSFQSLLQLPRCLTSPLESGVCQGDNLSCLTPHGVPIPSIGIADCICPEECGDILRKMSHFLSQGLFAPSINVFHPTFFLFLSPFLPHGERTTRELRWKDLAQLQFSFQFCQECLM